ncbi:MAG: hypothetical protein AWU54_783 [Candidatus Frackibacter sp. T328-2]|nr:MAG: hypothetical protein AWU54_783 [Candidatus Frackibacter sp. T328-2]
MGEEKRNIDAKIKNYENLKNHDKKLTNKIKSLEKEKNKVKEKIKIVDTDHDGVNDKREVRGDDGQLKTNPDKGDIKKGKLEELKKREKELTNEINKLKKQRKKVRKKIKGYKIDKLKSRSKKIGAALKVVTKTKKQMLQLTGNDELEKTARVLS